MTARPEAVQERPMAVGFGSGGRGHGPLLRLIRQWRVTDPAAGAGAGMQNAYPRQCLLGAI